ncbi:cytochrome c biogenesis heme-transporting ATPase CcmA [Candidatus Sororendozoicomonas aggregata]|uniref:cytochrome c biogenesis heme-transporting ATPase CcmA n=1 Tax=Candidatus Sororendozoicomonas aggregata TaxID=3073239 RepID=UPI002ED50EE0
MLNVVDIEAERDDRVLFANLTFNLNPGETLQIKGANGAGKTTLLKVLAGLSHDFSGEIRWRGVLLPEGAADFRLATVFLGHNSGIKLALTPLENLTWRHHLSGKQALLPYTEALARAGLQGYETLPCYHLSAGQQRRVALASLLVSEAALWILDEPFTALDVDGVAWLETLISAHAGQQGMTLLTSHQPLTLPSLKTLQLEAFSGDSGYDD